MAAVTKRNPVILTNREMLNILKSKAKARKT